jgi:hypothetical protein
MKTWWLGRSRNDKRGCFWEADSGKVAADLLFRLFNRCRVPSQVWDGMDLLDLLEMVERAKVNGPWQQILGN